MSQKLVSIITPTFNHGRFIASCVTSVLEQTYGRWEMIIVDDGSTDGTSQIVSQFADPRIKLIRQDHRGAYRLKETYNRALSESRGDFVAILEGDDVWPPYKLERQVSLLSADRNAVASYGRAGIIRQSGDPVGLYPRPDAHADYATTSTFLLGRAALQPVTVLLRRDTLESIDGFHGFDNLPAVDLATWLHLSLLGPFRFDDVVLGLWRIHHRQVTSDPRPFRATDEMIETFYRNNRHHPNLRGITLQSIARSRRAARSDRSWVIARQAMSERRFQEARNELRTMLAHGNWFRRIEAATAYLGASLNFDVNPWIERAARTRIGHIVEASMNEQARDHNPELLTNAVNNRGDVIPRSVIETGGQRNHPVTCCEESVNGPADGKRTFTHLQS